MGEGWTRALRTSRINDVPMCCRSLASTSDSSSGGRGGGHGNLSDRLKFFLSGKKPPPLQTARPLKDRSRLVDDKTASSNTATEKNRLPRFKVNWQDEFQPLTDTDRRKRRSRANWRIIQVAFKKIVEPPTIELLMLTGAAVLGIGAIEGTLLLSLELPDVWLAAKFVTRYAVEQLLPSCVWTTHDAELVARAMDLDPTAVLRQFDLNNPSDASVRLQIEHLSTSRFIMAGYMLLAQLVRAASIGASAVDIYKEKIRLGREAPFVQDGGTVMRLCGKYSNVTSVSLKRMGANILPVFEDPEYVSHLISYHSEKGRIPVYLYVRPDRYGYNFSWKSFPVDDKCFIRSSTGQRILVMEADTTNSDDPLSLSDKALDLTIDDASQAFRRIQERYKVAKHMPPFRSLRVLLANSLETFQTGGGYAYTVRHRFRYAKEIDVLIDSRAPVLQEILQWCHRVAGKERRVLFQTSSRQYFISLQLLMRQYGYEIYDPLDLRMFERTDKMKEESDKTVDAKDSEISDKTTSRRSLLQILLLDDQSMVLDSAAELGRDKDWDAETSRKAEKETLRRITKLSKLPRLIYYGTTAETVNAVEALVNAGEVEAGFCCALVDKEEGVDFLESVLNRKSDMVKRGAMEWSQKETVSQTEQASKGAAKSNQNGSIEESPMNGLHIICSSIIYDDLFRCVRQWAREGYSAKDIQKELDHRFSCILDHSLEVTEMVSGENEDQKKEERNQS